MTVTHQMPEVVVIVHLTGDANRPPVRVPSTVRLAEAHPRAQVFTFAPGAESDALRDHLGGLFLCLRPPPLAYATDTMEELVRALRVARNLQAATLYVSSERGHLTRALPCARILFAGSGVRVLPWPAEGGTYRSPWRRTAIDLVRACLYRAFAWLPAW